LFYLKYLLKARVSSVVFEKNIRNGKRQQNASALLLHTLKLHSDDGHKCLLIEECLREIEGDKDRRRERWSRQSCPACVLDGTGLCSKWRELFASWLNPQILNPAATIHCELLYLYSAAHRELSVSL